MLEFFLKYVACFLKVSLDAVVRIISLVAKNTLSGTPEAKYSTVSVPVYTSPCNWPVVVATFLVEAQAVNTKPASTTKIVFFKILIR
jgi:hypothetical protein